VWVCARGIKKRGTGRYFSLGERNPGRYLPEENPQNIGKTP
jgi:hypothetical protein